MPSARGRNHVSDEITDRRDAESLFSVIEEEVIPLFYERDVDGLPRGWIQRMMNSISSLAWRFSAHRMVMDYVQQRLPAGRRRIELRDERALGGRKA